MGAATLVSVEDYLNTSFPDGDREYVDDDDHASDLEDATEGIREATDGVLCTRDPVIELPLSELFRE